MTQTNILKDKEAVKNLVRSMMELISEVKIKESLLLLKPYIFKPKYEFDSLLETINIPTSIIEQKFGKTIGFELIEIQEIGKSLMLIIYIQKCEKDLIRWHFYFCKPYNTWLFNSFHGDDKIKMILG